MIPFFVGYALLVWYFAAMHRRTPAGYAAAVVGVGLLILIMYFHWLLGQYHPDLMIQGLQILLYPYTVAVGLVGLFIALLPRRIDPGACARCGYDLAGLDHPVNRCPECGRRSDVMPRLLHRPSGQARTNLRETDVRVLPRQRSDPRAGHKDQGGDQPDEHPADR